MPIVIMAGTEDQLVDFARQSGHLADSTLLSFKGAGHMIHHSAPEEVVDGINLASRAGIAENGQLLPTQQPTTVDAGQKPEAVIAA
jgi:hypothetical protein